jgi:hypothetical protein
VQAWSPALHAAFRWFRGYVLRAGFLDGAAGWQIARFSAKEVFLKYRLLHAMRLASRSAHRAADQD